MDEFAKLIKRLQARYESYMAAFEKNREGLANSIAIRPAE